MATEHATVPATVSTSRSAGGAAVRFEQLEKRFGTVVAVDRISLAIEPGEFITLLGPSGSGKTTTLMMLAGFEIPTTGEIYIEAEPVAAVPPYRRNIGMVFQSYALFPHMTVAENIGFPLKMRKFDKRATKERVAEALRIVNLSGYETRYPRQLSGGQQQRIALARAIVFQPRVLLMDEPLGALDKQLRERLQFEIKRIHEQLGVTVVYVTHDQQEALVMSDRIAVMNHGRIEQIGDPTDLYEHPQNRFVASFIGESNFLNGTVLEVGHSSVVVEAGGATLRAVMHESASAGARATLAVRPEKLAFAGGEPARDGDVNLLPATVREVVFVGEMRRYLLETAAGDILTLKQQQRHGAERYDPGEHVELGWHIEDTRIVHLGDG